LSVTPKEHARGKPVAHLGGHVFLRFLSGHAPRDWRKSVVMQCSLLKLNSKNARKITQFPSGAVELNPRKALRVAFPPKQTPQE